MNLQGAYSGYVFSRNPVIIRETYPSGAFDSKGGRYSLTIDGTDIYGGRFFPPMEIDLSEILDSYISFFPEPQEDNSDPLIVIEDQEQLGCRKCRFFAEYDSIETEAEFTVIPGGVSKQNYRRLLQTGQDAFTARFLNPANNFFMTTRTAGWRVIMKETELYPLYFLNENASAISVMEMVTKTSLVAGLGSGVYALDIDALRRRFLEDCEVIPNVFDIYMDSAFACRIVVERSDISKERYRLKFRNSLGVFEIIEVVGRLTISPEYSDSGDDSFKRYDPVTGDFFTDRERVERRQSVSVETGVKRPDEVRFFMDMVGSDEVYLLDLTPFPLKVIPSVEDFTYKGRQDTPENFTLNLEISDTETNIMQEIIDGTEGTKPRVFSRQFSKQFN